MKDNVTVIFPDNTIYVDGRVMYLDGVDAPDGLGNANAIQWHCGRGEIEIPGEQNAELSSEEDYEIYVRPYVDRFEEEDARIEEEFGKIENVKSRALSSLKASVDNLLSYGHTASSAGFEINADTGAFRNVQCLLLVMENAGETNADFVTYSNETENVSVETLKTIQTEIAAFIAGVYARKWFLRSLIEDADTREEVESIQWDGDLNLL